VSGREEGRARQECKKKNSGKNRRESQGIKERREGTPNGRSRKGEPELGGRERPRSDKTGRGRPGCQKVDTKGGGLKGAENIEKRSSSLLRTRKEETWRVRLADEKPKHGRGCGKGGESGGESGPTKAKKRELGKSEKKNKETFQLNKRKEGATPKPKRMLRTLPVRKSTLRQQHEIAENRPKKKKKTKEEKLRGNTFGRLNEGGVCFSSRG